MDHEKICTEILASNKSIRYVGIYDYGELYDKLKDGVNNYLTREETEMSLSQAVYRWSTRKKTTSKIGYPIYALAKYAKIYRMTIPISGAGLILITTELNADIIKVIEGVLEIKKRHDL